MPRSSIALVLALAAGACASAAQIQPWVDPATTKTVRGGMGKVTADSTEWTTFAVPAGSHKVYVFDVENAVPVHGFEYAMKDDAGKFITSDSTADVVHRVAVEANGQWAANAEIGQGWQAGKVSTETIQPGKFRIYMEVSSDKFAVAFRLRFKT